MRRYKKSTEILYIEIDDPRCLNSVIKELEKALPDMVSYQVFADPRAAVIILSA